MVTNNVARDSVVKANTMAHYNAIIMAIIFVAIQKADVIFAIGVITTGFRVMVGILLIVEVVTVELVGFVIFILLIQC